MPVGIAAFLPVDLLTVTDVERPDAYGSIGGYMVLSARTGARPCVFGAPRGV